jgi:predicted metal-dependent peptidase
MRRRGFSDDRARRVEHRAPGVSGLRELRFGGGGGTDVTPLLQEADAHRPDVGVTLTDLEGSARFRPRWPLTWAVPAAHAGAVASFGRVRVLD